MSRTITVRFSEEDEDYKKMVNDLRKSQKAGNPYYRRSESEIVKLLLKETLFFAHQQFRDDSTE